MSNRGGARTPLTDRDRRVISPSPARDALQGNLDSSRTITTKRSWFGSARNMISKHVPLWKTEEPKAEPDENVDQASNESEAGVITQQDQSSSNDSTTPLRPRPERSRTFTPKSAVSSLRQHIQSSRGQRKRGALGEITGNEVRLPVDPGSLAALEEGTSEDALKTHVRKNSLGRSLVGSIRNLGSQSLPSRRISPTKRNSQDGESLLSPTKGAAAIPLPSSPIPIEPPPTLQLDLGPAALVSPGFGRSPVLSQREELMSLTSPALIPSIGPVPTYYTRLPGEWPGDHAAFHGSKRDSLQPSDLLQLPVDEFGFSMPSGPTTPMPGTGAPLEFDGGNDPSEIFERSLEYKDKAKKKEDRKLKKMVSLDAMAEECVSPVRASPVSKSPRHLTPAKLGTPLRKISGSTIQTVPDDMPPLTRQMAQLQTAEAGHRDPTSGEWQSEDPFAPSNAVGDLATTPSPGKTIKLPLRPKITLQSVDSTEPRTLRLSNDVPVPEGEAVNFSDYPKAVARLCFLDGAAGSAVRPAPGRTDSTIANVDGFSPTEAERHGSVVDAETLQGPTGSSNTTNGDSGEYSEFKTQHIFGDLNQVAEPEYDIADAAEPFELIQSLRHSPSVKQIYERISKSHTPSPRSVRSGNVADIFWKPNVGDWMKESEGNNPGGLSAAPSPRRDITELSIDMLSTVGDHPTPNPSPTTTTPDRTPMGSRIEFDLKRSARNMRYNALSDMSDPPDHESAASDPNSIPAAWGRRIRAVTGSYKGKSRGNSSIDDDQGTFSLQTSSRYSAVNLSSDSITADLKDVIAEHYVFQNAMADLGPEDFPTPTASSSQALLDAFEAVDGCDELSPSDSTQLWETMEHSVFDTPLGGSTTASPDSKHHRESQEYTGNGEPDAEEPAPPPEDTLDDCLEMFHHYNRYQVLSSDPPAASEDSDNPFSSPQSEDKFRRDSLSPRSSSSTPNKKPTPARYRSQKGRH